MKQTLLGALVLPKKEKAGAGTRFENELLNSGWNNLEGEARLGVIMRVYDGFRPETVDVAWPGTPNRLITRGIDLKDLELQYVHDLVDY